MKQEEALKIMQSGHNVFLTGMAGSGKSYILNKFIDYCETSTAKILGITASTGIAATHIGGVTIHSWSGIGVTNEQNMTEDILDNICRSPYIKNTVRYVDILIIDEISMLHAYQLDGLDYICKTIRNNDEPFGGIQVILTGDFLQLPPITKHNTCKYAFEADIWNKANLQICYLEDIYRQEDSKFIEILNEVRYGVANSSSFNILKKCINKKIEIEDPTELHPFNKDVDFINKKKLNNINKPLKTYNMTSFGEEPLIKFLKNTCISPEALDLKEDAHVIFTKNNFNMGYSNGTFGIVKSISSKPIVQLSTGEDIVVERVSWDIKKWDFTKKKYEIKASINQYPLKLAYALTAHKSQGCTLEHAKINLSNLFSYNMGYVALSRVKSLKNLTLIGLDQSIYLVDPKLLKKDKEFKNA